MMQGVNLDELLHTLRIRQQKKKDVRESIIYILFVLFFLCVFFGSREFTGTFYVHEGLREALVNEEFIMYDPSDPNSDSREAQISEHVKKTYLDITNVEEFWQWVLGPLVNAIFVEEWYNGDGMLSEDQYFVQTYNKVVGSMRFRQLKVRSDTCAVDPRFVKLNLHCYDYYSPKDELKEDFGPLDEVPGEPGATRHRYQWQEDTGSLTDWGVVTWFYGKSGYVSDISTYPGNRTASVNTLWQMKNDSWVDKQTRVVFINFNIYNANLNLASVIEFAFEFTPAGNIVRSSEFRSLKLDPYITPVHYFVAMLEILFTIFLFYYFKQFLSDVLATKRATRSYWKHFSDMWNLLEFVNLVIFFVVLVMRILFLVHPERTDLKFDTIEDVDKYVNLEWLSLLFNREMDLVAFNFLLCFLKVFKYMRLNPRMSLLWRTLSTAWPDLLAFLIFFFIVFIGFAIMGHIIFGRDLDKYRNFWVASSTSFLIIVGAFDYNELSSVNRILAPVFFGFYVLLVYLVLINTFLAIINESFIQAKKEQEGATDLWKQLRKALGKGVKRVRKVIRNISPNRRSKAGAGMERVLSEAEIIQRLTKSEFWKQGHITFVELRTALGPDVSLAQAEKIMSRFDTDASGTIEMSELSAFKGVGGSDGRKKGDGRPMSSGPAGIEMADLSKSKSAGKGGAGGGGAGASLGVDTFRQLYGEQQWRINELERKIDRIAMLMETLLTRK